jgi:hypothetical protein
MPDGTRDVTFPEHADASRILMPNYTPRRSFGPVGAPFGDIHRIPCSAATGCAISGSHHFGCDPQWTQTEEMLTDNNAQNASS